MNKKPLVIVTPVYLEEITENELLSIQSIKQHLNQYDRAIISPRKFESNPKFITQWEEYGYKVVFFDNQHFSSIEKHNKFLMSQLLYETFAEYDYMLMAQLDVLIFSNSIGYWMDKKLDYVGSSWIINEGKNKKLVGNGGNGGLSLRNIQTFLKVIDSKKFYSKRDLFNILPAYSKVRNILFVGLLIQLKPLQSFAHLLKRFFAGKEDMFWSYYAPFFVEDYHLASLEDTVAFAFERYPEFCFEENQQKLPFGTHAWEKYNIEFWEKHQEDTITEEKLG